MIYLYVILILYFGHNIFWVIHDYYLQRKYGPGKFPITFKLALFIFFFGGAMMMLAFLVSLTAKKQK